MVGRIEILDPDGRTWSAGEERLRVLRLLAARPHLPVFETATQDDGDATMFFGAPEARLALYGIAQSQQADLAGLVRRLGAADRADFAERRARWARAGRESDNTLCHSPIYGTDITQRAQYPI